MDTCVLQQCWRWICQRGSSACTAFAPFLPSGILVWRKEASFAANTFFTYLWNQVLLQGKIGQIMSFWERHTFRCHHSAQPCFSCTISSLSQAEALTLGSCFSSPSYRTQLPGLMFPSRRWDWPRVEHRYDRPCKPSSVAMWSRKAQVSFAWITTAIWRGRSIRDRISYLMRWIKCEKV